MRESTKKAWMAVTAVSLVAVVLGGFAQPARAQLRTPISPITKLPTVTAPTPILDQSFQMPQPWSTEMTYQRGWTGENPRMLADVNGDRKQDVVGFGNDGVWVAFSDGTKFNAAYVLADFGYNQGWRKDKHVRLTGDVNGDKMEDIVGFG